jgi:hypothetical protein
MREAIRRLNLAIPEEALRKVLRVGRFLFHPSPRRFTILFL